MKNNYDLYNKYKTSSIIECKSMVKNMVRKFLKLILK